MQYLSQKDNMWLVFNLTYPDIDHCTFMQFDWKEVYRDVQEVIPLDAPKPHGKDIDLRMMVNSEYANNKMTRQFNMGFIIFANMVLIDWIYKGQPMIKSLFFGSWVCCIQAWDGATQGSMLDGRDDGGATARSLLHLWQQHVHHLQYP